MSDDEAGRWMRRGVAEVVSPAATAPVKAAPVEPDTKPDPDPEEADEPEAEPPPEIPRDWRTHHHMARIALARRLTDDEVETAADADKVIADEVARRAAPAHHQV